MIFTAEQVADMIGPDTPECTCSGCRTLAHIRSLICEPITAYDAQNLTADGTKHPAWLGVLMVAASRASAQGFSMAAICSAIEHGVTQAQDLNPHLHYTANAPDRPI